MLSRRQLMASWPALAAAARSRGQGSLEFFTPEQAGVVEGMAACIETVICTDLPVRGWIKVMWGLAVGAVLDHEVQLLLAVARHEKRHPHVGRRNPIQNDASHGLIEP
jgi:hypothetical protein